MLSYFEYVLPNIDMFFKFHCDKNFRGLNFTSYCRGKATLEKICRNITKDKKTLIGFGDYSQQHGLVKNHPTTPILKLKKELRRFCDVVDIDEWGTSKRCHKCHNEIELYKNRVIRKKKDGTVTEPRLCQINSVVRCELNECKLCCIDRDINASINILYLLKLQKEGKRRPKCFRPDSNDTDETEG